VRKDGGGRDTDVPDGKLGDVVHVIDVDDTTEGLMQL